MDPKRLLTALVILMLGVGSFILLTKPIASPVGPIEPVPTAKTPAPLGTEVDEITQFLDSLQKFTTGTSSSINPISFDWQIEGDTLDQVPSTESIPVSGKGFEIEAAPNDTLSKIELFFENQGFKSDLYNIAAGTISGLSGWKKGQLVCLIAQGVTGYKEAVGQWVPPVTDKYDADIRCGFLPESGEELVHTVVGGEFTIRLEANTTTGYRWETEYNKNYLRLVEQNYEATTSSKLVGTGGQETFTFQALTPGETKVTFSYSRPWEEEIFETRSFTVSIE